MSIINSTSSGSTKVDFTTNSTATESESVSIKCYKRKEEVLNRVRLKVNSYSSITEKTKIENEYSQVQKALEAPIKKNEFKFC